VEPTIEPADDGVTASTSSAAPKYVAIGIVIVMVIVAFAVMSRPVPGQRTSTATSLSVIIGGEGGSQAKYPILLREGGDPAHEADHIVEPLLDMDGVATATLDWSNGVFLIVEFDPAVVSSSDIANAIAQSGYLAAPTQ